MVVCRAAPNDKTAAARSALHGGGDGSSAIALWFFNRPAGKPGSESDPRFPRAWAGPLPAGHLKASCIDFRFRPADGKSQFAARRGRAARNAKPADGENVARGRAWWTTAPRSTSSNYGRETGLCSPPMTHLGSTPYRTHVVVGYSLQCSASGHELVGLVYIKKKLVDFDNFCFYLINIVQL